MIKYILHWWLWLQIEDKNKMFYIEFLHWLNNSDKILFIAFAKNDQKEQLSLFNDSLSEYWFLATNVILASENIDELLEQIKNSKYIYIAWWDYLKLYKKMSFIKDNKEIFEWKIVAWSSAWTNLLSNISYSNDTGKNQQWYGFLDLYTVCHYKDELKDVIFNKNLEEVILKEKEYIVIED